MPTTETFQHTFKNGWRDVFLASWMKYPHPRRPDILASDMIAKEFDPEQGILRVTRLIQVKGFIPSWLQYLTTAGSVMYIVEESETNVRNRTYAMRSKNLTFADILKVEERCVYQPEAQWLRSEGSDLSSEDEEINQGTHFEQSSAGSSPLRFIGGRVEQFVIDTAKKNIELGREIMNEAIAKAATTRFNELL